MLDDTTPATTSTSTATPGFPTVRVAGRWMVTFTGFPLGGWLTSLVVGPVNGPVRAVVAGLITGAVLGAIQVWGLGRGRPSTPRWSARWVAATAAGLAVGLAVGAGLVGFGTGLVDLLVQGAVCGAVVGVGQAWLLRPALGRLASAWPALLSVAWAAGWAITTAADVQVDRQFSVFGSSGAVVVTAVMAVLPVLLHRSVVRSSSHTAASGGHLTRSAS